MSDQQKRRWLKKLSWLVVGACLGLLLTLGGLATLHATDEAEFCGQCHVMDEAAVTHQRSLHNRQACNDCHMPQGWLSYLPTKTAYGLVDVYHNFTNQVPDVIHAGAKTKAIVQSNCLRCHGAVMENVTVDVKGNCVDCHRQVPHQRTAPISLRKAADA